MFFRKLFSVANVTRPWWTVSVRGRKDLPICRGSPLDPAWYDYLPRYSPYPSVYEDPLLRYQDYYQPVAPVVSSTLPVVPAATYPAPAPVYPLPAYSHLDYAAWLDKNRRYASWQRCEVLSHGNHADIVQAKMEKDGLHLELNVSHYEPEEVLVKVVGDRLIVSAKHTHKPDQHGFVAREFKREFLIPEEVNENSLASHINDNGHLIITAPIQEKGKPSRKISTGHDAGAKDA